MNQSMLTPIFRAVGMPYIAGAPHGSGYNYISNGVFLEGQATDGDTALVEAMAAPLISFAYSDDLNSPDGMGLRSWPKAFPTERYSQCERPSEVDIQLTYSLESS